MLRIHGIQKLYHFTDTQNVWSIESHGLLPATTIVENSIASVMNSDDASRRMDTAAGLANYVRLSFTRKNPMMIVAKKEERIMPWRLTSALFRTLA